MARNMTIDDIEKQSAAKDAMANMLSTSSFVEGLSLSSLKPPGNVVEVAKETVAMRAATPDHDLEVLMNHLLPLLMSHCDFE